MFDPFSFTLLQHSLEVLDLLVVKVSFCYTIEETPAVLGDMDREVIKAFVGDIGVGFEFVASCMVVKADTDSEQISVAMTKSGRSIGEEEENVDISQSWCLR